MCSKSQNLLSKSKNCPSEMELPYSLDKKSSESNADPPPYTEKGINAIASTKSSLSEHTMALGVRKPSGRPSQDASLNLAPTGSAEAHDWSEAGGHFLSTNFTSPALSAYPTYRTQVPSSHSSRAGSEIEATASSKFTQKNTSSKQSTANVAHCDSELDKIPYLDLSAASKNVPSDHGRSRSRSPAAKLCSRSASIEHAPISEVGTRAGPRRIAKTIEKEEIHGGAARENKAAKQTRTVRSTNLPAPTSPNALSSQLSPMAANFISRTESVSPSQTFYRSSSQMSQASGNRTESEVYRTAVARFRPQGIPDDQDGNQFVGYRGIYISRLPNDITDLECNKLISLVQHFGEIVDVNWRPDKRPRHTTVGVTFRTVAQAIDAFFGIEQCTDTIRGRHVRAREYHDAPLWTTPTSTVQDPLSQTVLPTAFGVPPAALVPTYAPPAGTLFGYKGIHISNLPPETRYMEMAISTNH